MSLAKRFSIVYRVLYNLLLEFQLRMNSYEEQSSKTAILDSLTFSWYHSWKKTAPKW